MGTHRLHSRSFLGLPYGIRNINHKKELLWSLWEVYRVVQVLIAICTISLIQGFGSSGRGGGVIISKPTTEQKGGTCSTGV